ncbi:MAG TPA: glycosyltransferase [Candidatus Limnocylindrales bacterium]
MSTPRSLPLPDELGAVRPDSIRGAATAPVVDVVVPVYNEAADLEPSIRRLRRYLDERFPFAAQVTIVDNASTDGTWAIASDLAAEHVGVSAIHLDLKGRGRALRAAWMASPASVVAYMDVDLSTDLDALLPLVAPLISGHSDLAIGSRLAPGARVVRGPKRELISRSYNLLLRTLLRVRFRDAQCGFKAIRRDVARRLLPAVQDQAWFFDTELLVLAERLGLRIHEVPVDWVDDTDSRVDIRSTALADLRGVWRLLRHRVAGGPTPSVAGLRSAAPTSPILRQVRRFVVIGVASTVAYILLYGGLRTVASAPLSNALALVGTAIGNSAANRRLTFEVRGSDGLARHHLTGLLALGIALAITSASIGLLSVVAPQAGRGVELMVLVVANAVATVVRFVLLRTSITSPRARVMPNSPRLERSPR